MEYEDYLAHYGVKGMKWGRRKNGSSGSTRSARRSAKKEAKGELKTVKKELRQKTREANSNVKNRSAVEKVRRDQKHLTTLAKIAERESATSIIALTTSPNTAPTLVSGGKFIDYISRGGVLDAKSTNLFYSEKSKYANENSRSAYGTADAKAVNDLRQKYETARSNYKSVKRG